MAQIIKHRRGTAAQLKTVTLQKAELGVSTGSVSGIETPVLHVGDGTNAAGFVVGRLFQGSTVPTLNSEAITFFLLLLVSLTSISLSALGSSLVEPI